MILTINLTGLSNANLLAFGQSLDGLLSPLSESISVIYNPFKNALKVSSKTTTDAISKQVAQQQTEALFTADFKRDNLFRGTKYILQANLLHPSAKRREAAVEVEKIVAKVGWNLHRESYDKQSVLTRTLLSELNEKHAERIALLGLSSWLEQLEVAQSDFDTLRSEQLEQQAEMEKISSMTAVRGDLEQAIKDLLEILPGYFRMTNDEALGIVLPKIKELIDRTK